MRTTVSRATRERAYVDALALVRLAVPRAALCAFLRAEYGIGRSAVHTLVNAAAGEHRRALARNGPIAPVANGAELRARALAAETPKAA
jgi:hypothetical protein